MPRLNPVIPRSAFDPRQVRLHPHPSHGESRAMISPAAEARFHQFSSTNAFRDYVVSRHGLFVNCNLLEGIPKVDGLYSLYLRGPIRIEEGLLKASADPNSKLPRLLDFLGVAQITAAGEYYRWTNRATAMPLVTAGQKAVFADDDTAFRALAASDFAPREVVYLPPEAQPFVRTTNRTEASIVARKFETHGAELEVVANQPSLLVVAQGHYHCWKALVDKQPQPIWRADLGYQALLIPEGKHVVKLLYRDHAFHWGMAITVITFTGCLATFLRRKHSTDTIPSHPGLKSG